jgi:hypothetical protein
MKAPKEDNNMKDLKMELLQLSEAIDMITVVLDKQEELGQDYDQQLVEQLRKLLGEREVLVKKMESLH